MTIKELIIVRNIIAPSNPETAKDKVDKYKVLKRIASILEPYVNTEKELQEDDNTEELEELYNQEEDVELSISHNLLPDDIEMSAIVFLDNLNILE